MAHTSVRRVRRRRLLLVAASIVAAMSLIAGLLAAVGVFGGWGRAPKASAGSPIRVHPVQGRKVPVPAMRPWSRPRTSWPAAETATAVIAGPAAPHRASRLQAGPSAGSGRAGTTPVWVGAPDAPAATAKGTVTSASFASLSQPAVSRVRVSMASHAAADALGVRGVVFSLARSDGSLAEGRVHVSLSYSSFAQAAGASYASRLHLVELPGCALTTPQLAQCRKQTPVRSADNVRVTRLGADVNLPGLAAPAARRTVGGGAPATLVSSVSPAPVVLAAAASASGSGGNFAAEPSSEADAWVASGSSGAFAHSYPIGVPPVPGGLEPHVSLDYRSQAIDGLTSATNNEASWIGDGWDYSPGYIEIEYAACSTVPLEPSTGDLCPETGRMILSRNGVSTPIVAGSGGVYKAEADGGEEVLNQGNYWEVIEPDGTQYYFGMNQLPGYASGDAAANSVWTAPVLSGSGSSPGRGGTCSTTWSIRTGTRSRTSTTPRPTTTPRITARPAREPIRRAEPWPRSSTGCVLARSTA